MEALRLPLFGIGLAAELALGALLVVSILRPERRVWPPPGRASWQYVVVWTLMDVSALGVLGVGLLDWGALGGSLALRLPLGLALGAAGGAFALWGIRVLGWHQALGLEGELVERGPYRVSRNPQYVGDIALLLGWAILCSSLLTWILCALGAAWFALAPLAEEPWLRERYGEPYEAYRRRVPRFLGRPSRARDERGREPGLTGRE